MIDEKKIEEAADKYLIEVFGENVTGNADFKDGINWFKENLWHDASEELIEGKEYLLKVFFEVDDGSNFEAYVTSTFEGDGWSEDFFPRHYVDFNVEEWTCIEDLMKGGK